MNQCVILIGGKGSRLGEITKNFPKPMLNIDEKPFLIHLINQIKIFGFSEVLLLAGHSSSVVEEYFKKNIIKNISIKIITEDSPLGTGGALLNAYEHLDDTFFLMNGDSIIDGNWLSILENLDAQNDVSMALIKKDNCSRYGSVKIKNNKVIEFEEKTVSNQAGYINGGIYCIKKHILKNLAVNNLSFENDILFQLVKDKRVSGSEVKGYFIDIGTPESLKEANNADWIYEKRAVIFDRDGTLNVDHGYTHKISDLVWMSGAISLIRHLNDLNYLVFVATNQAGIAKGKYKENDMHIFHSEMQNQLHKNGAHIDGFFFCPYHKDGIIPEYSIDSQDRKPNIGMLSDIASAWNLKKNNMLLVGDRDSDIQCAKNFGIKSIKYNGLVNLCNLKDNIIKSWENK